MSKGGWFPPVLNPPPPPDPPAPPPPKESGFNTMSDFCKAVMNAENGGPVDNRLQLLPDTIFERGGFQWRTNHAERCEQWLENIRYLCFDCGGQFVTAFLKPVTICPFCCGKVIDQVRIRETDAEKRESNG
jgi:hypothetical protein